MSSHQITPVAFPLPSTPGSTATLPNRVQEEEKPQEVDVEVNPITRAPPEKHIPLTKGAHGFFSPQIANLRNFYIKTIIKVVVLTVIVQWGFIPIFFGALYHAVTFAPSLKGWLIDRDGSELGAAMVSAFSENVKGTNGVGKHHLGWQIIDAATYPTNAEVADHIVGEKAWFAVVVEAGATARLTAARQNGDASYNPASAVTFYYNQARNELAAGNAIVPLSTALLTQTLTQFGIQSTTAYMTQNGGNATAMSMLARAPQTLVSPASYTSVNLRVYSTPVATAVTLVGQIFLIIFAFIITMANYGLRAEIAPYLTMKSYMVFRIVAPLIAYVPMSFSYTMIDLAFKIPFDAKYSYAGGFFIMWLYMQMGMTAMGFATESVITVLGPRFMPFFLLPLIITNVSVALQPLDLMPWIYRYGYGFPIYNLGMAIRTIIFNTNSHLGQNAGVVIAWIVVSAALIIVFTYIFERAHWEPVAVDKEKAPSI